MDSIPWLIQSDLEVLCLVYQSGNGETQKELMTLADIVCWITRTRGVTEATMLDHDLAPMFQAGALSDWGYYNIRIFSKKSVTEKMKAQVFARMDQMDKGSPSSFATW